MAGMYFTYGSYQHPAGEVAVSNYTIDPVYGANGDKTHVRHRMEVRGTLVADGPAAISSALNTMEAAYSTANQLAALRTSSGALTHHNISPVGSSTGVRVRGPNFPGGEGPAQFATGRDFTISFEAQYPVGSRTALIEFRETVTVRGSGGPRLAIREVDNGLPIIHQVSQSTPVYVSQSGFAIGRSTWPSPSGPILGNVQNPDSSVTYEGPIDEGADFTRFVTRWSYNSLSAGPQNSVRPRY